MSEEVKKCKGGCGRLLTPAVVKACPELKSGYCNWCRPDQIPLRLRIYTVYRRNDWFRKGCYGNER